MADEEDSVVKKGEVSAKLASELSSVKVASAKAEPDKVGSESQDASLEDIAGSDGFSVSGFEVNDMPTPTLSSQPSPGEGAVASPAFRDESLEQSAQGASSSIGEDTGFRREQREEEHKPAREYVDVYNMPDYQGGMSEEKFVASRDEMRKRGMTAQTFDELRHTKRVVSWDEYPEIAGSRGSRNPDDVREYSVIELGRKEDDTPHSPLERRRDYKPLKR